ncbi:hypothetical protein GCM10010970_11950 [Silvimonas iriomotensis]|uniref:Uncharacterized protein n=1 Tax=Silvimonas iriomotensis TaxID=449662 RepID=A0ABQ2P7P4_9NEIS|nr:hypothetical protein GCM10010970_11950 [Silvimonas iriomotensis]
MGTLHPNTCYSTTLKAADKNQQNKSGNAPAQAPGTPVSGPAIRVDKARACNAARPCLSGALTW